MATILIADDDESMRLLLSSSLERAGHIVLAARTGSECLEMACRNGLELIIVDSHMPPSSGLEVISQLRSQSFDIPVILISAAANEVETFELDPRTRFLPKPFSPPRLIAFVSDVLAEG